MSDPPTWTVEQQKAIVAAYRSAGSVSCPNDRSWLKVETRWQTPDTPQSIKFICLQCRKTFIAG